ncbi:hypothetical protein [Alloprevotella tannerae]|uniref:hypothetical protein n=1 Tax=Alloprevotella tannerae TaxID=76122 RepID=UPI0028D332BE|nr:hypothetical protein [Alloprevotella tannerae]
MVSPRQTIICSHQTIVCSDQTKIKIGKASQNAEEMSRKRDEMGENDNLSLKIPHKKPLKIQTYAPHFRPSLPAVKPVSLKKTALRCQLFAENPLILELKRWAFKILFLLLRVVLRK